MLLKLKLNDSRLWIFLFAFASAGVFALFTQHAWEDYYITYRASKNLATGHGLVFNHGERLHTFTSPIGVLLPAVASLLTLNKSDPAALWIFRVMSCAAFAGASTLLFVTARRLLIPSAAAVAAVIWLGLDAKSVDFSINGMETGFMLLFLGYMVWTLFSPGVERRWLHLGCAWAGLMWTRPDSFIYIALLAVSTWIFNAGAREGIGRKEWITISIKAGLMCTVLYLPWFLWAWAYYGSPVPHTIVAKASVATAPWTAQALMTTLLKLPALALNGQSTLEGAFLPTYFAAGGWPQSLVLAARCFGIVTACLWFLPRVRREIRAASLAFIGAHVYLTYFPYYPFPWYLPPTTFLAFFAWAGLIGQFLRPASENISVRKIALGVAVTTAAVLVGVQGWMFQASARQMAALQTHIDSGNRQKIGEWLAKEASPGDRVFMEPLGYIGFFSGLKTYDWPGLSSREVVEAHAQVGAEWARIVTHLGPDWLVLRPREVETMNSEMPGMLARVYAKVREFDVRSEIAPIDVRGKRLLEMDATFHVYHRRWAKRFVTEPAVIHSEFPGPEVWINVGEIPMRLVHAPGSMTVKVPKGARYVRVSYGISADAYAADPKTDGADFEAVWKSGAREVILHRRSLDPGARPADRGSHTFDVELPDGNASDAQLVLSASSRHHSTKDWTCWSTPDFR